MASTAKISGKSNSSVHVKYIGACTDELLFPDRFAVEATSEPPNCIEIFKTIYSKNITARRCARADLLSKQQLYV